jgi:hypothetical protein
MQLQRASRCDPHEPLSSPCRTDGGTRNDDEPPAEGGGSSFMNVFHSTGCPMRTERSRDATRSSSTISGMRFCESR